jgi:predicted MPP superfamily phosphohydrolase
MIWVIIFCSAVMVGLDYKVTQIFFGREFKRWDKWYLGTMWATDLLPLIFSLVGFCLNDNSTSLIMTSMWIHFTYMVTAIARQPFNIAVILSTNGWIRFTGAMVSLLAAGIFFYGMAVTRTGYIVEHIELTSERLPKEFDGYKITHITDLHIGSMVNPKKELSQVAELCNSLQSDAVMFTGDLINVRQEEITPPIADILSNFKAKDGVFSVMGNHDIGICIKDTITHRPEINAQQLIDKEQHYGWQVLEDKTVYIKRGADSIAIMGISFRKELHEGRHSAKLPDTDIMKAYNDATAELFNITLAHIPQHWDEIVAARKADLTLSGHVHAMQMRFPLGKRGISPSQIIYKRWSGLYEEQGRWLYINDGIGCIMYPMRIGTPPTITQITLKGK